MGKIVSLKKQNQELSIKFFFVNHRLKNAYTRIYFLPTIIYMFDHHESYFDPGSFSRWKLSLKFLTFGVGFWITKENHG
jgi:hypothetical protein